MNSFVRILICDGEKIRFICFLCIFIVDREIVIIGTSTGSKLLSRRNKAEDKEFPDVLALPTNVSLSEVAK